MKNTTYICNLCRDQIREDSNGRGVHFVGSKGFIFKRLYETEAHICNGCVETIVRLNQKDEDLKKFNPEKEAQNDTTK